MQTMLIRELKKRISDTDQMIIYDAPPGTSCSVVETIHDADYIILVTEPTPFGLYDLQLMLELIDELKKPFGVIINKSGLGDRAVYDYITANEIELLGEIPFSSGFARAYAEGKMVGNELKQILSCYEVIAGKIIERISKTVISIQ
jgi:MinD superfamily P-loop ATPase